MKAHLVPIYFVKGRDEDFDLQPQTEAAIFPQFLGKVFGFQVVQL